MIHGIVIGLVFALVSFASPVWATVWNLSDCSQSTVQAKHNDASVVDGDTLIMPPCTVTWTGLVTIYKAVTLTGSGSMPAIGAATSGGTTININGPSVNASLVPYDGINGNVIISNLHFVVGSTATVPTFGVIATEGRVDTRAQGKLVVIHHITMEYHQPTERSVRMSTLHGVLYRNLFTNDRQPPNGTPGNTGPTIQCKGNSPLADNNWASASTFGTADSNGDRNLYVETNTFTNMGSALDIDDGCRAVIRYNTFIDATHADHGHDTSQVGIRHYEIYNNEYRCVNDWNFLAWYGSRGGTGVITDNIMPNTCYGRRVNRVIATIQALRRGGSACYPGPYPWLRQEGWGWAGAGDMNRQVLEPIYIWNNKNTSGGAPGEADDFVPYDADFQPPCSFNNSSQTSAGYIQRNREYFLGRAKPGYTKFTYPHPLATATGAAGTLAPPTGLTVR